LGNFAVNIRLRHCFSSAQELIDEWNALEVDGFPLDQISSTINTFELITYLR
jgi:hypothetical protein